MTRKPRTKANIENKIVELYIRLHKRQTQKPARLINLRKRLEFFKGLLQEIVDNESTSSNSDLLDTSGETLRTDSPAE